MFKDTPKGLLEAVLAVHKESREKFVQEQKERLAKKAALGKMPKSADGKADPAANSGAKKMAEELHGKQHKLDVAKPKGKLTSADFKALRMKKEEAEQIDELSKKTLGRYVDKATDDMTKSAIHLGGLSAKGEKKGTEWRNNFNNMLKRKMGIVTAVDKLSKPQSTPAAPMAKSTPAAPMAKWPDHLSTSISSSSVKSRGGAGVKQGRAYGGAVQKEEVEQIDERRSEGKPIPKMLGAGIPKRSIGGRAYGGKDQDYEKKDKAKPAAPVDALPVMITSLNQAGKDVVKTDRGRRLLALQIHSRAKDRASVSEEKDTPGNGYTHQCALHVKSEQYGEGRTLTSQHAEPDAQGHIAWYDVMFDEGIVRMNAEDLEILVSESHGNHKKMKK